MQTARSLDASLIRLRQHGTLFLFFTKKSQREFFCEKEQESSALPEAISSAKRGIV
jgi:hypothetical protein